MSTNLKNTKGAWLETLNSRSRGSSTHFLIAGLVKVQMIIAGLVVPESPSEKRWGERQKLVVTDLMLTFDITASLFSLKFISLVLFSLI